MATLVTIVLFFAFIVASIRALLSGDFVEAGVFASLVVLIAVFFATMLRASSSNRELAAWFDEHRDAIARGESVELAGVRVDEHTRLVRFDAVLSLLLVTWQISSQIYVRPMDGVIFPQITYSLFTLVFGWWGFPHGLWRTPLALIQNALRAKSATLGEIATGLRPGLFPELEAPEPSESEAPRVGWNQPASPRTSDA